MYRNGYISLMQGLWTQQGCHFSVLDYVDTLHSFIFGNSFSVFLFTKNNNWAKHQDVLYVVTVRHTEENAAGRKKKPSLSGGHFRCYSSTFITVLPETPWKLLWRALVDLRTTFLCLRLWSDLTHPSILWRLLNNPSLIAVLFKSSGFLLWILMLHNCF